METRKGRMGNRKMPLKKILYFYLRFKEKSIRICTWKMEGSRIDPLIPINILSW